MNESEHSDLLASMPVWVQVSANLGMFLVAVIAGAFGFFRKHAATLLPAEHFAEGGTLATFADDVKTIATSLKTIADLSAARAHDEEVEREVQRRLAEERGKY